MFFGFERAYLFVKFADFFKYNRVGGQSVIMTVKLPLGFKVIKSQTLFANVILVGKNKFELGFKDFVALTELVIFDKTLVINGELAF